MLNFVFIKYLLTT